MNVQNMKRAQLTPNEWGVYRSLLENDLIEVKPGVELFPASSGDPNDDILRDLIVCPSYTRSDKFFVAIKKTVLAAANNDTKFLSEWVNDYWGYELQKVENIDFNICERLTETEKSRYKFRYISIPFETLVGEIKRVFPSNTRVYLPLE